MDTLMELDELKQAWKTLDARLALYNRIQLEALHERKVGRMRSRLRPLFWGQLVQVLLGIGLILIGARTWTPHMDVPHLLLAGLSVHVLGIATLIAGGMVCSLIVRIDHTAPVLLLQRRLAQLRKTYILAGICTGLPWWVMWVPVLMALAMSVAGIDLYAVAQRGTTSAGNWLNISLGIGVLGLLATVAFHRWSRHPDRAALGRRLDDGAAGCSLRRAQAELDELTRYVEE